MKITPLFLFILLVFLLLFLVIFRWPIKDAFSSSKKEKESFVEFNYDGKTDYSTLVSVPNYNAAAQLYKVYDSFYFDPRNGNLVEVVGTIYSGNVYVGGGSGGNVYGGNTLTGVNVFSRMDGSTTSNTNMTFIPQTNQLTYWSHSTTDVTNPNKSTVYYFAWNTDTYIHTVSSTNNNATINNISTSRINGDNTGFAQQTRFAINTFTPSNTQNTLLVNNGTYKTVSGYPKKLYMITNSVGFDVSNSNLVICNSGVVTSVFNRSGSAATTADISMNSVPGGSAFAPFVSYVDPANNWVLYMQGLNGTTLVVLFYSSMNVFSVTGFTPNGVWVQGSPITGATDATILDEGAQEGTYAYWLAYWNSISSSNNPTYSEDYLLKTQVVPPVCPSCPSCIGGACVNCGGVGGSGTLGGDGRSVVGGSSGVGGSSVVGGSSGGGSVSGVVNNAVNTAGGVVNNATTGATLLAAGAGLGAYGLASNAMDLTGQGVSGAANLAERGVGGAANLAERGVGGAANLAERGVSGAANLAERGIGGTVGLARETVGGTVGLAKETVGGAVGLAKETVGGAVDLLKSAGTGVKDVLTQGPGSSRDYRQASSSSVQGQQQQQGMPRYNTAGADPYSYYGALPSKGSSDYIPVTADFSAFSK
jgi:hypothetical protein